MKLRIRAACSAILAAAALSGVASAAAQAVAESKMAQSSVSMLVEPQLKDGRLVVKVAAKNLGSASVAFGPSSIGIAKPDGQAIAIYPLSSLVNDVRLAAGLPAASTPQTAPTAGAYASPQQTTRDGRMDVTGFTGGSTIGGDEYVRQNSSNKSKPAITTVEAEAQIAALKQAILQDSTLGVGQVAAGQVVTEQLKFGKKEDRTLHLRVRVGSEVHGFTIEAPKQ
jgi:hypothetical protein